MSVDVQKQLEELQRLQTWPGLQDLQDYLSNRKNFFRVVRRIQRVEGVHSDMLAWMLDPNEPRSWHGLGDRFAARFIRGVLEQCGESVIDGVGITVASPVTEESTDGEGPVDILLKADVDQVPYVIGIENKIDSREGKEQVAKYAKGLRRRFPTRKLAMVLLSLDGDAPSPEPNAPCARLRHKDVAEWLEWAIGASRPESFPENVGRELVKQYLEMLRTDVMKELPPLVRKLCEELYRDYPRAWQAMLAYVGSTGAEFLRELGAGACGALAKSHGGTWRFSVCHNRYCRVYRPEWRRFGKSQDAPVQRWDVEGTNLDWGFALTHIRLSVKSLESGFEYDSRARINLKLLSGAEAHVRDQIRLALETPGRKLSKASNDGYMVEGDRKTFAVKPEPGDVDEWVVESVRVIVDALDKCLPAAPEP